MESMQLGLNVGNYIDQLQQDEIRKYIPTDRVRYMGDFLEAYPLGKFPVNSDPILEMPDKSWRFMQTVNRLKKLKKAGIKEIQYTFDCIFVKNEKGEVIENYTWPNKFIPFQLLGRDEEQIEQNGYKFGKLVVFNLTDVITHFEIGNEWWGTPGIVAWQAFAKGVIKAFREFYNTDNIKEWPIQLCTPAVQATKYPHKHHCKTCDYLTSDHISYFMPNGIKEYISFVTVHPYPFKKNTFELNVEPLSNESEFPTILGDVCEWVKTHAPHCKVQITEFGNDSNLIGVIKQKEFAKDAIAYVKNGGSKNIRELVVSFDYYEGFDNPGLMGVDKMGLFGSCGVWETEGNSRKPTKAKPIIEVFGGSVDEGGGNDDNNDNGNDDVKDKVIFETVFLGKAVRIIIEEL